MVNVIFEKHGDGEICVMNWFAFLCFDMIVSYPIYFGLSVRLAIWKHAFYCQKPIEWCDTCFRLCLIAFGQIDRYPLTRSALNVLL